MAIASLLSDSCRSINVQIVVFLNVNWLALIPCPTGWKLFPRASQFPPLATKTMHDQLQAGKCAKLLRALADPERLKIVQCLKAGPRCVGDVAQQLGAELVNVSHHLGVLRNTGFVVGRKQGKQVIYSLNPDVYIPATADSLDVLNLGCCRLELGQQKTKPRNDSKPTAN